jgi:hypothetical protein
MFNSAGDLAVVVIKIQQTTTLTRKMNAILRVSFATGCAQISFVELAGCLVDRPKLQQAC